MKRTIRQLREERGESLMQLASALRISVAEPRALEEGVSRPSVERVRHLARLFGVAETEIDLEPDRSPSVGQQIADALFE